MKHYIYPLKLLGPVHFGDTGNGGTLENVVLSFSSDSLYSAICNEIGRNVELLESFRKNVKDGELVISSLFHYYSDGEENPSEWQYYLPKPIYTIQRERTITTYAETKEQATILKKVKKVEFVRSSLLSNVEGQFNFDDLLYDAETMPEFGSFAVVTRVNKREILGLPYHVGSYVFNSNSGLYFIVGFQTTSSKVLFDQIIELLSYSGIGGKRSSGYGKFECLKEIEIISTEDLEDVNALYRLITNKNAQSYMSISSVIPDENEVHLLQSGTYSLKKRSGFVSSSQLVGNVKRNSCYSIKEGSCFVEPLKGKIIELQEPSVSHVIERHGIGFFVGVDYE